jgi:flagellar hook-associated protein 3 FlgL
MSVSYIGSISSSMLQSILDMRSKLDDLQRQLGSGEKSTTYAGLGVNRGVSLSLRSQLGALSSYDATIANVGVRLGIAQSALNSADGIVHIVKNASVQSDFTIDQSGQTGEQKAAFDQLDQLLALFNSRAGDRYLFSGMAVDQPAVPPTDTILNGDGSRAGLKQVIAERQQADLGASGLGRLTITNPILTPTSVTVAEDAVSPFGFKLNAVNSTLSNATVTGPGGGPPPSMNVDFTANPNAGEQITLGFTLPDGTTQLLTMTATTASPPGADQFIIGANATATATNLQTALTASVGKLAAVSLTAASAMAAGDNFFNTDSANPPQRVDGPPFDTATALIDGTNANTVQWYIGEDNGTMARSTVSARVDPSVSVNYGIRANEQALRVAVQNIAVFAVASFTAGDPNASDAYTALGTRIGAALDGAQGQQKIPDIAAEIASAQTSFNAAKTRHQQTSAQLTDLLQNIEGVSQDDVGAKILSLQTSLQASLQTTALLSKMSLVNFLPS